MTNELWRSHHLFPYHEFSSLGNVRVRVKIGRFSRNPGAVLKQTITRKGYMQVRLKDSEGLCRLWFLHRILLEIFVGPAPTEQHQCAHNNGIPSDNRIENLRWATPKENQADRVIHGTSNRGEQNPMYIHGGYAK